MESDEIITLLCLWVFTLEFIVTDHRSLQTSQSYDQLFFLTNVDVCSRLSSHFTRFFYRDVCGNFSWSKRTLYGHSWAINTKITMTTSWKNDLQHRRTFFQVHCPTLISCLYKYLRSGDTTVTSGKENTSEENSHRSYLTSSLQSGFEITHLYTSNMI